MSGKVSERDIAWAKRVTSRYVQKSPYFFHPDKVLVRHVQEGLAKNKAKHGKGYCPCRPVEGDRLLDLKNICPCKSHKEDIARKGTCECGIFVSKEFLQNFPSKRIVKGA